MVSGNFNQEGLALLSKRDKAGWGLLHWAAFCGHEREGQRLLEKEADIAKKDRSGQTALSTAAIKGQEAVVESKGGRGRRTPLLLAARNGHEAVVKLLLEKGADVESKVRDYGPTPLSWAAEK